MKSSIKIGRDGSNDVVINEPRVSRNHAVISQLSDGSFEVKDLGSTNGTFVNGSRISQKILNKEDKLEVAGSIVNWFDFMHSSSLGETPIKEEPFVKILKTVSVGTSEDNDIIIRDNFVSGHHAKISLLKNGDYFIEDLISTNGTFVNGSRVVSKNFSKTDIIKLADADLSQDWIKFKGLQKNFLKDHKKTLIITISVLLIASASSLSYINRCSWFGIGCNLSAQEVFDQYKNAVAYISHSYYYTIEAHGKKYFVGRNKQFGIVEANSSVANLLPYDTVNGSGCFVGKDGTIQTSPFVLNPWFDDDKKNKMLKEVKESKTLAEFKFIEKICGQTAELKFLPVGLINNPQNYINGKSVNECVYTDSVSSTLQSVKLTIPKGAAILKYSLDKKTGQLKNTPVQYYNCIYPLKENVLVKDSFYGVIDTSFDANKIAIIPVKDSLPSLAEGSPVLNERGELIGRVQQHQVIFLNKIFHQLKQ